MSLSREETDDPNYMQTTLDMNNNDLINVGFSPFVRLDDFARFQIGDFGVNPITLDLEFTRGPCGTTETLYTFEQLRAPIVAGSASFVVSNNLSEVVDPEEAASNLGLSIGVDVLAYSPLLDIDSPDFFLNSDTGFVQNDDSRLDRLDFRDLTVATLPAEGGTLYSTGGATLGADVTTTLGVGVAGQVQHIYVDPRGIPNTVTLVGDTPAIRFFVSGSVVELDRVTIPSGSFVSVACIDAQGTHYVVSGPGLV